MKKILSLTLAIILFLSVVLYSTNTFATETADLTSDQILTTGIADNETVTANEEDKAEEQPEIHEGDLYVLFGENDDKTATKYTMDKLVDGNVFIMGNEVEVTGQINGSLFVMAAKVTIAEEAYIGMDLFVCAQDVVMEGYAFDIYGACKNFELTNSGVAYRDLKLAAENAHLIGSVGRDVDLTAGSITVYDDDDNKFFVGRNLNYSSESEIEHLSDITVRGEVKFEKEEENENSGNVVVNYVIEAAQNVTFSLAVYLMLLFLAPKFVLKMKDYVSTRGLLAAAIGLAFTIVVPIVAIVLLFTVIGTTLTFLVGIIYVLVLMLNTAIVTVAINELICNKVSALGETWKKVLMIIPVAIGLYLVEQIPFLGGLISLVVFSAGVGIVILYQFDKRKKVEG